MGTARGTVSIGMSLGKPFTGEMMETEVKLEGKYQIQEVKNKAILITGGTTGIGRATALLLASKGARVMILGRHEQELNDALADLKKTGGQVSGITADTSRAEDVDTIFREVDKQLGGLDILINNAALPAQDTTMTATEEMAYVVNTNLLGYLNCAHHAMQRMKAQGRGHIVNIGSMSAQVREKGSSVYVATKAGIEGFSEALRKEVNEMGIKVSLIEPGEVGSDMNPRSLEDQRKAQENLEQLRAEDIAACVYYCLTQPQRTDVVLVQIRPHLQAI